jgi:AraC-like DNA-binding protein
MPDAVDCRSAFSMQTGQGSSAARLLDFLCNDGEKLSGHITEPLVTSFLRLVGENIRHATQHHRRQTCTDRRLEEIEAYVMLHLTDPDLSFYKVAESCEISPRYLSYLLKAGGTSFSDLLWGRRLSKATEWLISVSMRDRMIQEIAFMAGFKSAAHFSRMFKAAHHCSPKEYRESKIREMVNAQAAGSQDGRPH